MANRTARREMWWPKTRTMDVLDYSLKPPCRRTIIPECPSSGTHNVESVKRLARAVRFLAWRLGFLGYARCTSVRFRATAGTHAYLCTVRCQRAGQRCGRGVRIARALQNSRGPRCFASLLYGPGCVAPSYTATRQTGRVRKDGFTSASAEHLKRRHFRAGTLLAYSLTSVDAARAAFKGASICFLFVNY